MSTQTKGEATRERILDLAIGTASTMGLDGLSIGNLARDADMSKSGVFAHFGSKEDLQIAVLRTARQSFIDAVFAPAMLEPRGEPRLRAIFRRWLDWEAGSVIPGGCPILRAAYEYDDRPGPVRDEVVAIQAEFSAALERAARLGIEEGHFTADADPAQIAVELGGLAMMFHLNHRLLDRADSRTRAETAFEALVSRHHPH